LYEIRKNGLWVVMASKPTKPDELGATQGSQDLLRCDEAAELLRVGEDALSSWRRLGKGPKFIRYGLRCVRYRRGDLLAWISEQEVEPRQVSPSRLVGQIQDSGLAQYFERYERRTPIGEELSGHEAEQRKSKVRGRAN
jgi:hypothetical protein